MYLANRLQALLGVEQSIRMENFFTPGSLPMGVTIIDENGHSLISLTGPDGIIKAEPRWMQERSPVWLYAVFSRTGTQKACRHPRSVLSILCL